MERMYDVMRVMGGNTPVLWIRFNPDAFRINGEQPTQPPSKDEKVAMLIDHLKKIDLGNEPPSSIQVRYLFYDDNILAKCESYDESIEKDYSLYFTNNYAPNPKKVEVDWGNREQHADTRTGDTYSQDSGTSVLGE